MGAAAQKKSNSWRWVVIAQMIGAQGYERHLANPLVDQVNRNLTFKKATFANNMPKEPAKALKLPASRCKHCKIFEHVASKLTDSQKSQQIPKEYG